MSGEENTVILRGPDPDGSGPLPAEPAIPPMVASRGGRWWRRRRAQVEVPRDPLPRELDAVFAELIETVWAQERAARREDRVDTILRYAPRDRPRPKTQG